MLTHDRTPDAMTLDELLAQEAAEQRQDAHQGAPVGLPMLSDAELLEAAGTVRGGDALPPLAEGLGVRETARAAMRGVLPELIRAAQDSGLDVRERVAAAREIARLSGIADEAAPQRVARTWAELEADWADVQQARAARLGRVSAVG